MGSSSTLVVVEWNSPEFYRYFDDVTLFLRIPNILGNLVSPLTDSELPTDFFFSSSCLAWFACGISIYFIFSAVEFVNAQHFTVL